MRIDLISWNDRSTWVEWNPKAGSLTGPGATALQLAVDSALAVGEIVSHPWPTVYAVRDPLHDLTDMAVVVAAGWRLPQALAAHYPPADDDSADNPTPDIGVLY